MIMVAVPFTEGVSGDELEAERDAAPAHLARNQLPGGLGSLSASTTRGGLEG